METTATYYIDLITRYFYGEATPKEITILEGWVKEDPENAEIFSAYYKTWKAVEHAKIESSIDLDYEWNSLANRIKVSDDEVRHSTLRFQSANTNIPSLTDRQLNPKSKIVNRTSRITYWSLRIAAIFLLMVIPAFFLYHYYILPGEKQLTASAGVTEHILPDGTVVTLNTGATLTFPARFEGSFRKVKLQGEAWFEVAHDKTKPFIIAAENARIRVVGTTFFVNTHTPGNTKEIILSEGVVRVYYQDKPRTTVLLFPGEKAEMASDGYELMKTNNEDANFLAWKTKHMVFDNTPLTEVVEVLTNVYHTTICLSGNGLGDCMITATFDKQSLESVLNVLKATLDLQVRNSSGGIELTGHGCNQAR